MKNPNQHRREHRLRYVLLNGSFNTGSFNGIWRKHFIKTRHKPSDNTMRSTFCRLNQHWQNFKLVQVWRKSCRSRSPRGPRRGSAAVRLLGLWVRIPPGGMECECCVLLGLCLWFGLITRPEESYRMWCVLSECDCEASIMRSWPTRGCCAVENKWRTY